MEDRTNQRRHSDDFVDSLAALTPDKIAPPKPKKKLSPSALARMVVSRGIVAVCVLIIAVSAFYIGRTLYNYKRASDIYSSLEEQFGSQDDGSVLSHMSIVGEDLNTPDYKSALSMTEEELERLKDTTAVNDFAQIKARLNALSQQNPELYGWITIDGTRINYPLVQHSDNEHYLNYAYTGDYLPAGSIFVDFRCNKSIMRNFNTVIYGHHMNNGTMFYDLDKYFDETFFREHPYIYVYTQEGSYKYEVFAAYETTMTYKYIDTDFLTAADFVDFANEMKSNSVVKTDVSFNEYDRILTLSTCTNRDEAGRICVQAKLVSWS